NTLDGEADTEISRAPNKIQGGEGDDNSDFCRRSHGPITIWHSRSRANIHSPSASRGALVVAQTACTPKPNPEIFARQGRPRFRVRVAAATSAASGGQAVACSKAEKRQPMCCA